MKINVSHLATAAACSWLLAGCAGIGADQALSDAGTWARRAGMPAPALLQPDASAAERRQLLRHELDEATAVQLAMRSSPGLQALLADGWQLQADTQAAATWPRLGLSFERARADGSSTWTRGLSLGLAELLTLPWRQAAATRQQQAQRLALAQAVLQRHAAVRSQWARAVTSRQQLQLRERVLDAAEAGAELARRLQAAGNYSRLQRAREELVELEARAQLTRARAQASADSEALVRLLGLNADEAAALRWPDTLPDAPAAPRSAAEVALAAARERLDLQLAQAQWQAAGGAPLATRLADAEATLKREHGDGTHARSVELALALPLPAEATLRAQARSAAQQAAAQRLLQAQLEATSTLRETHAAYLAAHALALQHQQQLLPLRERITQDSLHRYNGMLGSVFDLLADARAQAGAQVAALDARRDLHLATVALDAAILGVPANTPALSTAAAEPETRGGH